MKCILEWQVLPVQLNIIYQDITSSINLEENGKENSCKQTRHFDINYFYVTNLVGQNEVKICTIQQMKLLRIIRQNR